MLPAAVLPPCGSVLVHQHAVSTQGVHLHVVCRSDHTLMRLVGGYPSAASPAERCAYIADQLSLAAPADPGRVFAVGQLMPGQQRTHGGQQIAHAATSDMLCLMLTSRSQ